ncbi:MAG: hypothetical protein JWN92_1850 [Candidatus Acidoferrum typicum]|nr:hypothetical protein [Candidatus Acidoferrum typicum]
MFRGPLKFLIPLSLCCAAVTSCGGRGSIVGGTPPSGTAPVVLAMTDTPPTNVSILAAEVTLTGATLNPGNVSLLSTATTVELRRLQTDIAYLGTTNVNPGNYTSLTLTFANPSLTIENDTGSVIGTCRISDICTMPPTSVANLSTTIILPTLVTSANTGAGLLVDVNLENLLSAGLGADFRGGTTVSEFTPASTGSPLVGAEDVVGQVMSIDAAHNTFSFQNATGQFSLLVDSTTTFFQFPSNICTTSTFTCLHANQILSVDISFRSDGTPVARNVVFEDSDNSDAEVEGIVTGTTLGSQQFTIVTLAESAAITGLKIGDAATVNFSVSLPTVFDVDFTHADATQISTGGFSFVPLTSPTDLFVGQQVQIRRNPSSTGLIISADRVRLRSSRITATVQTIASPTIFLTNLPFIFSGHAITPIQAQTFLPTIFSENSNAINISFIPVSGVVSVRGPLFNVGGTRTLVATKVVLKP